MECKEELCGLHCIARKVVATSKIFQRIRGHVNVVATYLTEEKFSLIEEYEHLGVIGAQKDLV